MQDLGVLLTPSTPITDDDDAIRNALACAEVPALLPALAYLTGDMSLLRPEFRPDPNRMLEPGAGLDEAQLAAARALAFDALVRFRDGGSVPAPPPGPAELTAMLEFATGGGVSMDDYLPLFREELSLDGEDLRAPAWQASEVAPGVTFRVVVIGAGMSGILAAHRLGQAGLDYVVLEKNDDVGGTWLENTYPGCRVDVSNLFYSYSFAVDEEWPQHFSSQDVLLDYFRRCATRFGVRDRIRFRTEVRSAIWDDDRGVWVLDVQTPDGDERIEAHAVISAVGQLNRPNYPNIPGRERYTRPSFHSARWDHSIDLTGKRVAVIGTGASAAQFIPIIAEQVEHLTVFQRTPNWLVPTPDYHDEIADGTRWLFQHLPGYAHWNRFWLFWRSAEGMLPMAFVDEDWPDKREAVGEMNELLRQLLAAYIESEFGDRPDLLEKVMPHYPPAAKRVIRDNGIWARTLKRENVTLLTDRIAEITETGIRTGDGVDHEFDVIIYGTGFQASKFLTPMRVVGREGVDLHERWDGNARAYLGITVPGFPNFFCLYGPNTNIVINGSIIYFSECEVQYVMGCLRLVLERNVKALDCRPEVHDAYNERIDAENCRRAWGVSDVNSWYKNEKGRVAQNWPGTLLEYWQQTREPNPDDYELLV